MWQKALTMAAATLAIGGCGMFKKETTVAVGMTASPDVPAARGTVEAWMGDDGNTAVRIRVEHLAPPEQVVRDATTYVVWARPVGAEQGHVLNLGALRIDRRSLRGELKTLTPLRHFEVFITAEPLPTVTRPSRERVLHAEVHRAG